MSSNLIPRKKGENDFEFTKRVHTTLQKRKAGPSKKGRALRPLIKAERPRRELRSKPQPKTKGLSVSAFGGVKRLYK